VRIPNNLACAIVTIHFQAAKDAQASQDTFVDIFERFETFFRRLEIYTEDQAEDPPTEMIDIITQTMVEVLSILGIATKEIKQSRMSE
jgi:hypothetical protein